MKKTRVSLTFTLGANAFALLLLFLQGCGQTPAPAPSVSVNAISCAQKFQGFDESSKSCKPCEQLAPGSVWNSLSNQCISAADAQAIQSCQSQGGDPSGSTCVYNAQSCQRISKVYYAPLNQCRTVAELKPLCDQRTLPQDPVTGLCKETETSCKTQPGMVWNATTQLCKTVAQDCTDRGLQMLGSVCKETGDSCQSLGKILDPSGICVAAQESVASCSNRHVEYNRVTGKCIENLASCTEQKLGFDSTSKTCTVASPQMSVCTSRGGMWDGVKCLETAGSCSQLNMGPPDANSACTQKPAEPGLKDYIGIGTSVIGVFDNLFK